MILRTLVCCSRFCPRVWCLLTAVEGQRQTESRSRNHIRRARRSLNGEPISLRILGWGGDSEVGRWEPRSRSRHVAEAARAILRPARGPRGAPWAREVRRFPRTAREEPAREDRRTAVRVAKLRTKRGARAAPRSTPRSKPKPKTHGPMSRLLHNASGPTKRAATTAEPAAKRTCAAWDNAAFRRASAPTASATPTAVPTAAC
jgi:hypothetical protein